MQSPSDLRYLDLMVDVPALDRNARKGQSTVSEAGAGHRSAGSVSFTMQTDISGVRLADDVVHVTYLSRRGERFARRSSIWLRTGAGWRLYFHQGTLTQIG
jgi:hypothetical protein